MTGRAGEAGKTPHEVIPIVKTGAATSDASLEQVKEVQRVAKGQMGGQEAPPTVAHTVTLLSGGRSIGAAEGGDIWHCEGKRI